MKVQCNVFAETFIECSPSPVLIVQKTFCLCIDYRNIAPDCFFIFSFFRFFHISFFIYFLYINSVMMQKMFIYYSIMFKLFYSMYILCKLSFIITGFSCIKLIFIVKERSIVRFYTTIFIK